MIFYAQVLNDTNLRRFAASERVTGYDQELLAQYQLEFFTDMHQPAQTSSDGKTKKVTKAAKKRAKCPWAVTGQRHAAFTHIQALDKMLVATIGVGLIAFQCEVEDAAVVKKILETKKLPPTLILHADEGSPAYAMNWYLRHSRDLRFIPQRDIYHREWNDVKNGVARAGLWGTVLLTTVCFDLFHGPWESAAWFSKISEMVEEMVKSLPATNPLWTVLYQLICADLGLTPSGEIDHSRIVWDILFSSEVFKTKGEQVSLRRWFGWIASADRCLKHWHAMILAAAETSCVVNTKVLCWQCAVTKNRDGAP